VNFSFVKAHYLDASAAVKLVVSERGSEYLRAYFNKHSGFHITSFCLFESFSVLKRKMLSSGLTLEQYLDQLATARLFAREAEVYPY
jgi:hypothetical protein